MTDGDCAWDEANLIFVCAGGDMPWAQRGGTTFGNTFISRVKDSDGEPVGLEELMGPKYTDLREHEGQHAQQGRVLGPLFPVLYFLNEGLDMVVNPDAERGCNNLFERDAGLEKGNYPC